MGNSQAPRKRRTIINEEILREITCFCEQNLGFSPGPNTEIAEEFCEDDLNRLEHYLRRVKRMTGNPDYSKIKTIEELAVYVENNNSFYKDVDDEATNFYNNFGALYLDQIKPI